MTLSLSASFRGLEMTMACEHRTFWSHLATVVSAKTYLPSSRADLNRFKLLGDHFLTQAIQLLLLNLGFYWRGWVLYSFGVTTDKSPVLQLTNEQVMSLRHGWRYTRCHPAGEWSSQDWTSTALLDLGFQQNPFLCFDLWRVKSTGFSWPFLKGSSSKSLKLCRPHGLCYNFPLWHKSRHHQ